MNMAKSKAATNGTPMGSKKGVEKKMDPAKRNVKYTGADVKAMARREAAKYI